MNKATVKYCSRKCYGYSLRKTEYRNIRNSFEYRDWRKFVFNRDNRTCQDCGEKSGNMHAHHVFPFSEFPEHRFEVWNGVTLCSDCHAKIHPFMAVKMFKQGAGKSYAE
jgi:5-methylcytosine-specific restriction endonuclease McrA